MSNQQNDEFEERSFEFLLKISRDPQYTVEDLALACYHFGVAAKDLIKEAEKDLPEHKKTGYTERQIEAAEHAQGDR